jgi:hypothetical protein
MSRARPARTIGAMRSSHAARRRSPALILAVPLALALILTLFAWPSARLEPRDLPVGVAGPAQATKAVDQRLAADPGAFDVHRYATADQAREAIQDRQIYGAFVAGADGMTLLTASAASASVANALSHAAAGTGAKATTDAEVQDVVAAKPATTALPSSVLPLIIGGSLTAALALALAGSALGRAALLGTGALLGGIAATAIVQGWLGVVDGDAAANAGALSLMILAIGATVAGLQALLGHVGTAIGVFTMVFVGNPFSGIGSAPELLPEPVGAIGRLLPPGAGGNLLRSTGLFDGAGAGGHAAVLAAWAVAGLAALGLAGMRAKRAGAGVVADAGAPAAPAPAAA